MRLNAAAATDVGLQRRANEDCHAVAPDLALYVVADGMGGHAAGQLASDLACRAVVSRVSESVGPSSLSERLRGAVASANEAIFQTAAARPELQGMGTTVVALLASGARAAVAHVGDSRVYRVRDRSIRQLTDDHSLVGELVRRRQISPDDAREHPHRHVLTRALGVRGHVEPDLAEFALVAGDVFVLCTDGLTAHVSDDEMAKRVGEAGDDLQETAESLVDLANQRGGEDNITVALIRIEA